MDSFDISGTLDLMKDLVKSFDNGGDNGGEDGDEDVGHEDVVDEDVVDEDVGEKVDTAMVTEYIEYSEIKNDDNNVNIAGVIMVKNETVRIGITLESLKNYISCLIVYDT